MRSAGTREWGPPRLARSNEHHPGQVKATLRYVAEEWFCSGSSTPKAPRGVAPKVHADLVTSSRMNTGLLAPAFLIP